jgi:putative heme-binding domain-containing protein
MDRRGFRTPQTNEITQRRSRLGVTLWRSYAACWLAMICFGTNHLLLAQDIKPAQYKAVKQRPETPTPTITRQKQPANPVEKPTPKRIWSDPNSPGGKNSGDVFFRRIMELPEVENSYLEVESPSGAEVYFNGRRLRTIKPNSEKERIEIVGMIRPGKNCIAIRAMDRGNQTPGARFEFYFKPSKGNWRLVVSDSEWIASKNPSASWQMIGFNDRAWYPAIDLDVSNGSPKETDPESTIAGNSTKPKDSQEESRTENPKSREAEKTQETKKPVGSASVVNTPASRKPEDLRKKLAKRFKTVPGFTIDEVADPKLGSVLAMAFNEFGHIVVSLEGGGLALLYENDKNGLPTKTRTYCDLVQNVQGILPLNGDVYVTGEGENGSGLYRLIDENRDGELEKAELLTRFLGTPGEHGAHQIALGPDGFLYITIGNHAIVERDPELQHSYAPPYEGDLVQPRFEDPGGHASGVKAPGGTVVRYDLVNRKLSIVAGGLRNAYDLAFHPNGSLYLHDSDMEADIGAVWHRSTSLFRIVEGGEYGWRSGWANWPDYYLDRLPSLADTGRGSPTGIAVYNHHQFPIRYHRAIFSADWSEGRIIALPIESIENGQVKAEDFVAGTPMNVTDLEVGPEGSLYFSTGGRGTEGGIFRVRWEGEIPEAHRNQGDGIARAIRQPQLASAYARQAAAILKREMAAEWDEQILAVAFSEENPARYRLQALDLMQLLGPVPNSELLVELSQATHEQVRTKCARFMGLHPEDPAAVKRLQELLGDSSSMVRLAACESLIRINAICDPNQVEALLESDSREERYFGRRLLRNIPADEWKNDLLKGKSRVAIQASLALVASQPDEKNSLKALETLLRISKGFVSDADFLDLLRSIQVTIDTGKLKPSSVLEVAEFVEREFPSGNSTINGELIRLATYCGSDMVPQCVEYLNQDVSLSDRMLIAMHLPLMPHEWTSLERMAVLQFLETCLKEKTGSSYPLYIMQASEGVAKHLTEREALQIIELGKKYPNAALCALFKIEGDLNDDQIDLLTNLDAAIDKGGLEEDTYKRLKTGITAVLSQQDNAKAIEYLQQRWRKSPDRRAAIALALAQKPSEANWDYLIRSMGILEPFAVPDICNALLQIDAVTDDAEAIRQTILQGCRLVEARQDPRPVLKLLEYWTGHTPEPIDSNPESPLAAWQAWFVDRYPDSPPANLPSEKEPPRWSLDFIEQFLSGEQGREGSAAIGATVYTKARCSSCHKMNSQGGGFGPDLTSINRRFTRTEVLESILFPSHVISDQYASKKVLTKDGESYNGIVVNTPTGIAIRVSENKEVIVPKGEIDEIVPSKVSSMPYGLFDDLSPTEIRDLMCFLGFIPEEKRTAEKPATIRR